MFFNRTIVKSLFVTAAAFALPVISYAADPKISSFELGTQGSAVQGATTEYTFAIEFSQTVPSGTTVSILTNQPGQDTLDMSKLLNFSSANATSSTLQFTGSTSSIGSGVYELFLTADASVGKHQLTASNVVNPSADVCLVPVASTQELGGEGDVTSGLTGFTIGSGSCASEDDSGGDDNNNGGPADDDAFSLTAIGNYIVVQWEPYTGVATYGLSLDLDDNMDNGNVDGVTGLTDTTYIFSNLEENTTYYVAVNGSDTNGNPVIVPYPVESVETAGALDARKPGIPLVKKIKATEARVQWGAYSAVEQTYLDEIVIRVKKGKKKVKTVSVVSSATKKKVKELKSATTYIVQIKEVWNISDTEISSKWSKKKSFTTKKK